MSGDDYFDHESMFYEQQFEQEDPEYHFIDPPSEEEIIFKKLQKMCEDELIKVTGKGYVKEKIWICHCGKKYSFQCLVCTNCGFIRKDITLEVWTCECGNKNPYENKFCLNCGLFWE